MRAAGSEEAAASIPFWARIRCQARAADVLPSGDDETEPGRDGMCEVRETRKGERWQVHAAVMPSAECVGCHGPEELRHQMLRPANVVSE